MAFQHSLLFAVIAAAIAFAVSRRRIEPILALILGGAAFGVLCGLSVGQMGKSFATGFGNAAAGPGVVVIAAAWIGAMAEAGGAARYLAGRVGRRSGKVAKATSLAGLVAGIGASPAAAFAVLGPLGAAVSADPIRLALAISAGQGLLLPSPVMVAAATILGADWRLTLAIGLPCAVALCLVAGRVRGRSAAAFCRTAPPGPPVLQAQAWPAMGLVAVSIAMIVLLIVQSLGDIPSEPLGGGSARELLLGLGRPFILLLVGLAGMAGACGLSRMEGMAGVAIGRAAPMVLLLGAAGGLQTMAQDSRMSDSLAEAMSGWHAGLLAPFMVACCLKLLVGSSPVAAISAAGMLQPALGGLGLDDPVGHACAALAVGAGAMAGVHVNDGFFWLVTEAAGLRAGRGMAWLFAGTLLQGCAVVGVLWLVHAVAAGF